jgi:hypothetical protein
LKKLLHGILLFLIFIPQVFSQINKPVVDLILPTETSELEYISKKLSKNNAFNVTTYINALPKEENRGDLLIIVSDKLLPLMNTDSYPAKFALYVNSLNFKSKNLKASAALFSDQPIQRQLLLLSHIFDKKIIVGIPYYNDFYKSVLTKEADNFNDLEFLIVKTEINDIRTVSKVIQNSDVLLATPEKKIYNSQTIRSILLSSYRHQTAVIGPNEGFVTAGALASVASSSDQYIDELIIMIEDYIETKKLPESRYPKNFIIKINTHVAESLGISISSEDQLLKIMKDD